MEPFKVTDDLWLCENAVFLPPSKTLVVSDLQLGLEQQLRERGADVLLQQGERMRELLTRLVAQTGAARLVIDGDLKHEFGRISYQERRDLHSLLSELKQHVEVIAVKGNHDTMTAPIVDALAIPLLDRWAQDGFYVIHGHELPDEKDAAFRAAHTIIIGHTHPAITLDDGVRKERYKCFLIGSFQRKRLVVLPSFSTVVEGTDVLRIGGNSPLLRGSASSVYVLADEIRPFGTIAQLRRVLG